MTVRRRRSWMVPTRLQEGEVDMVLAGARDARLTAVAVLAALLLLPTSRATAFEHFDVPELACRVHRDRTVRFPNPQVSGTNVQFQASYRDVCEVDHYAQLNGSYQLFQNGT